MSLKFTFYLSSSGPSSIEWLELGKQITVEIISASDDHIFPVVVAVQPCHNELSNPKTQDGVAAPRATVVSSHSISKVGSTAFTTTFTTAMQLPGCWPTAPALLCLAVEKDG